MRDMEGYENRLRVFRVLLLAAYALCGLPVIYIGFQFVRDVIRMIYDGSLCDVGTRLIPDGPACTVIQCGVRFEIVLAVIFLATAGATFWTWAYSKAARMRKTSDYMPRMKLDVIAGTLLACCAATSVSVTGISVFGCVGFFNTALADSNGAGPLVAVLVGPILVGVAAAASAAQWIATLLVVPGYFLWRKMAGFITWTWITGRPVKN